MGLLLAPWKAFNSILLASLDVMPPAVPSQSVSFHGCGGVLGDNEHIAVRNCLAEEGEIR